MWNYPSPRVKWPSVLAVVVWFALWIALTCTGTRLKAQEDYAAALQVIYPGVELRRANTEAWLALPPGAQTTFGAGDSVRTDMTGRAFITFENAAETLVMPATTYQLAAFVADSGNILQFHANLEGRIIQRASDPSAITDYRLQTARLAILEPAFLFAVQTYGGQAAYVIAAQDSLQIETQGQLINIPAGYGLRALGTADELVQMDYPMRFSTLAVPGDSCRGLVSANPEESVEVRTGPGRDYKSVGSLPNGIIVPILGISENRVRYLTPFLSGFGWIIVTGIKLTCDDLPTVQLDSVFPLGGVVNAQPFELELLEPFFGRPEEDRWFYTNG